MSPKPWAKVEIGRMRHPKFLALSGNAIALWDEGKDYCDEHQTDGIIPGEALKTFRFRGVKSIALLIQSCGQKTDGTPYAPLWTAHAHGYRMHDYLDHNDCREVVLARISDKDWDRARNDFVRRVNRDRALVQLIRRRDGDYCRYCGSEVNWADRRGPQGGTYDHVDPDGPELVTNIVVACRSCNSRKGNRSLAHIKTLGMCLKPAPAGSRRDHDVAGLDRGQKPNPNYTENGQIPNPTTEAATTTETARALKNVSAEASSAPVLVFPTVGTSSTWGLSSTQVAEWQGLFPNIDVLSEMRKAVAWVLANPAKRKTAKGMPRFLVSWLMRVVDTGRRQGFQGSTPAAGKMADWYGHFPHCRNEQECVKRFLAESKAEAV